MQPLNKVLFKFLKFYKRHRWSQISASFLWELEGNTPGMRAGMFSTELTGSLNITLLSPDAAALECC